jgi:ELWxxDGT repeat protein
MPQLALLEGINASGQYGLWATDGTAANTLELTGIAGASASGLSPTDMTVFNSEVLFSGVDASGQYGLWVTDGTAAGTHELSGISTANSNGASPADIISSTLATTNNAINELITELYVGYYNRAPDPSGENYWVTQLNNGMSLSAIAQSYSVQTESTNLYSFLASPNTASTAAVDAFIASVYQNLFNRAPDAAGQAYYVQQLQNGQNTVGGTIIAIESGAQGNDLLILNNKLIVGDYFDTQIFNNDVQFSSTVALAALSAVTSSASSVATAETIVDTYVRTAPLASATASQAEVSLVGISTSHDSGIAG